MRWRLWAWWYWARHPREALCDAGVWKCSHHPRMLWLASERRWAWRHRLRARRVRRYAREQATQAALLALYATLAHDLGQLHRLRQQRQGEALVARSWPGLSSP